MRHKDYMTYGACLMCGKRILTPRVWSVKTRHDPVKGLVPNPRPKYKTCQCPWHKDEE